MADRRSSSPRRLGILGGGQLARMLAESAQRQGLEVCVLAPRRDEPAAIDGVLLVEGALDDPEALSRLAAASDVVTLENEFLNVERLQEALARHPSVALRPASACVTVAQDKLAQKRLFEDVGVATSAYVVLPPDADADDLAALGARFERGYVLKWSRFGYDGRGNFVVADPKAVSAADALSFCRAGQRRGASVYAEAFVDFACEVAMVSTRALDGTQVHFPLVISVQERSVCREVYGPATAFGVDAAVEIEAREVLAKIARRLDYVGTFAVEFFLSRDGRLLANEMAPRVHNTGHYTLFDDEPSQFDLHVQAVTGRPLSAPAVREHFVMRNLLGPFDLPGRTPCRPPTAPPPPGTELYWYHKKDVGPGRKMGHISGRAPTPEAIGRLREALAAYEHRFWHTSLDERPPS